jgi:hypothetical protein
MNKRDYFLAALKAGCGRKRGWVISVFAVTDEGAERWKNDPYQFRIVRTPKAIFFVNQNKELEPIDDVDPTKPLFVRNEAISLAINDMANVFDPIRTTYGNCLANDVLLCWPFGKKVPFITGRFSTGVIEDAILSKITDDVQPGVSGEDPNAIYINEYLKYVDGTVYLTNFTQLFTPAGTEKTMTFHPLRNELKKRLLEENKDRLHDPAVVALIEAELVKLDKEWLKGDRGEDFYIKGKSFNIVRKKLGGMYGAEPGLEEKVEVDLISNSLSEGWDLKKFASMNNAQRAGSFNRGAQTELGGEAVKALLRASSNINIVKGDCGTKLGKPIDVDGSNYKQLVGRSVQLKEGPILVDAESAKAYVGRRVMVRSPQFCHSPLTDRCEVCMGKNLADNPDGASVAISNVGSTFLAIFMSAAHSKGTTVAKMDLMSAFN